MTENFIDKTTSFKTVERISFELVNFAKGSKINVKVAFNPDDSMQVDQLLEDDPSKNTILMALLGFKSMVEKNLGVKIISD
jgi:hypothetical protein